MGPIRLSEQKQHRVARFIVVLILCAVPALMCLHTGAMADGDVWWHLRSAEWIVAHHAFPHVDSFSTYGMGKPWAAYSWLYELIIFELFTRWGLVGIVFFTSAMVAAIAAAFYRMVERLQPDFTKAALITIAGVVCLSGILYPRPWMFTIFFFLLEIDILIQARRTGRVRGLLWLPVIFALWANTHIQFADGLVMLGVAAVEPIAERWWPWRETKLRAGQAWAVLGACVAATLINPYGWRIYQVAYELVAQKGVQFIIAELQPLQFRDLADFLLLFLAMAAVAAIAWKRHAPFFSSTLLVVALYLSFHSMRDRWFLAAVACAILAEALPADEAKRYDLPGVAFPVIVVFEMAILVAGVGVLGVAQGQLEASLADQFPVQAVELVKQKGYRGPLFNDYGWGGYLIWALRQPVCIDGRASLQGDERISRNTGTWNGGPKWASDPDLEAAGLVIGSANLPLAQLLRRDPEFHLAYEDKVAVVFVRGQ